jgi:hypothetical protein
MSRFFRPALLAVAAAILVGAAPTSAPATGDGPTATASKSCPTKVGNNFDKYGPDYVLWIRARHVSCRKARERVRAFHDCRPGKSGRCPNLGAWNCSENRGPSTSYTYYSTVKCKHGRKVVKHRYQQNR